ncbi:hypothetical protein EG329_002568 [Mollisiaceae sp. DMI_Dod_QoI]|nr:hypothetical protein EG329_002568 [Helotiales sp. DMI_Dod_QoI]
MAAMTFSGTIANHEIQYNGTIEEIYAYIQTIDPSFVISPNTTLDKRDLMVPRTKNGVHCCPVAG